jgi:twitching motility two-component system response regulator PilG
MSQDFQSRQLLNDLSDGGKTGHLQITANSVTWDLYLIEGKLLYACHSLQLADTIKHYLLRLGHSNAAKIASMLAQDIPGDRQLIISVANQLVDQNYLNSSQRTVLIRHW